MKKLTIAALITFGLGGVTYTALAQEHDGPPPRGPNLEAVDTNQDGNITRDEMAAHGANRFMSADTNGDNLVSSDEFAAFIEAERERRHEELQARRFAKLDSNGDGVVSADEHASAAEARMDRMFERIDTDGDGVITEAEREAAKDHMRERRAARRFGRRG